jgi:hypothetical protein
MAFQVYAEASNQDFCKDYVADQKRIEKVKKYGWADMVYDRANKEMVQSSGSNKKYLFGCLDLSWKTALYENLCKGQNRKINLPKVVYFYFDGFGNYVPEKAKKKLNAVNVIGNEPSGSFPTGINVLQWSKEYLDDNSANYITNEENEKSIRKAEKVYSWKRDIEFYYYSGSGTDSFTGIDNAKACYTQIQKDLKVVKEAYPDLRIPKTLVSGYSNGGVDAIDFTNFFTGKPNLFIDSLITLDPVPKAHTFIKNKIMSTESVFQIKNKENIGKSFNFYQASKNKTLAGVMEIHGSKVEGVDNEFLEDEYYIDHVYITQSQKFNATLHSELLRLMD